MEWANDVLEAADVEQLEEEDNGGLVRTHSETFMDDDQADFKKYVYIDADNIMQGPFFEDQMWGWFTTGYFNRETNVSTCCLGGRSFAGRLAVRRSRVGASPTHHSSSPPHRAASRPTLHRHNALDASGRQQPQRKKPRSERTRLRSKSNRCI